ncbi:MAG: flavin reductase family protein [Pseudomonadota bacterium]
MIPVPAIVEHAPVGRADFLGAMRQVANPVTVVATDGPAGRHGATVSAFSSVSADPPTILVCLRADSRIADLVAANSVFSVHVLSEDDAEVARIFAGQRDASQADRFAVMRKPNEDHPAIPCATTLHCRLSRIHREHSHKIFIGAVVRVDPCGRRPLIHHDGAFRRLDAETLS